MTERLDASRALIRKTLDNAYFMYLSHEKKKGDSWRESSYGELYGHLKCEVAEIIDGGDAEKIYKETLDVIVMAALLGGKFDAETNISTKWMDRLKIGNRSAQK